jgi:hypothetical protein
VMTRMKMNKVCDPNDIGFNSAFCIVASKHGFSDKL